MNFSRKFQPEEYYSNDSDQYYLLPFRFHSINSKQEVIVNEVGDPTMLSNVSLYDFDKTREILVKAFLNDTSIFLSKPFTEY